MLFIVHWGIIISTHSENLDICPFCKKIIPQGPAYFCPTCGKKLDEKYSKRTIILEKSDDLIVNTSLEYSIDEMGDISSLIESNSSYSNDSLFDLDEDSSEEHSSEDMDDFSIENPPPDSIEIAEDDETEFENESLLTSQNNSIKLDLFLRYCVNQDFSYNFLKYKITDAEGDKETLIDNIISNFDLKSIMNFKYDYISSELEDILVSFFKTLVVLDLVQIAEKYDVKISLIKENLKNNFMEKFTPYELMIVLNNEGLNIREYLKISVLEQIYLLSDSQLEKNITECPNIEKSRYEMISCIVGQYEDGFLISNNKLDIGGDVE